MQVSRHSRLVSGDPVFLTKRSTPERLVVESSTLKGNSNTFPTTPLYRESKKIEAFGKRMFSSASLALQLANAVCLLGRTTPALWDMDNEILLSVQKILGPLWLRHFMIGKTQANMLYFSGLVTTDCLGNVVSCSVVLHDCLGNVVSSSVVLYQHVGALHRILQQCAGLCYGYAL